MSADIKTDEKKQHFDDIYVEKTPVPYKVRILDALSYISDDFNREMFDAHILPWAKSLSEKGHTLNFLDLCSCFGNTTMATIYGMNYNQIRENWKDEESCASIQGERRFPVNITGVDISQPALDYGASAGLYDSIICSNLNERATEEFASVNKAMADADILLSTAALVYLDLETIEALVSAFASGSGNNERKEGYVLVNFLNPFALEKADETKRILLKHLDFVGSRATRHRRMSPLEMENYPGEEWSLLELWVLKRRC
ncbi:hypothetical protein ACHAXS_001666 [Conticribra weissflogii]